MKVRFTLNGHPVEAEGRPTDRVLDLLRRDFRLTGTKEGCGEGECGACTILLDGETVLSCLLPLSQVDGREVVTVEGLARTEAGQAYLQRFSAEGGTQCGACTPGIVLAGARLLHEHPHPPRAEISHALAGNICRCTGYEAILRALQQEEGTMLGAALGLDGPARAERATSAEAAVRAASNPPARSASGGRSLSPESLDEALAFLGKHPGAEVLAGGTDWMVRPLLDRIEAGPLLDLSRVGELRGIRESTEGGLRIGATTTFRELERDERVLRMYPILVEAASQIGGAQIQNRATLGGNIVNASPAGDSLPVLLALDATVEIAGSEGVRRVRYDTFHTGYRTTALRPGELLIAVLLPAPPAHQAFRKVGTRGAQAISKVAVAFAAGREGERWKSVRIAAGSVAPTPIRLHAAEAACEGAPANVETALQAAEAAYGEIDPIDDVRSTALYRRWALSRTLRRILLEG